MTDDTINIRDLQHFSYCEHRWGLIAIDKVWVENIFVVKANLIHENVHQSDKIIYAKDEKAYNGVSIYNDDMGLFGVTDRLIKKGENYLILEYKPTKPKDKDFNIQDALQVFAQKICIDKMFNTNCKGYIYYKNEKTRVELPFDEKFDEYLQMLKTTIENIKYYRLLNKIPPIKKGQKCSGCSLKDLCIPKNPKKYNAKDLIFEALED